MKRNPNRKHVIVIGATPANLTAACDLLSEDREPRFQATLFDPAPACPEAVAELLERFVSLGGDPRWGAPVVRIETAEDTDGSGTDSRPVAVHYEKNHRTYRLPADAILSAQPLEESEANTAQDPAPADTADEAPDLTVESPDFTVESPDLTVTEEIPVPRKYPEPILTIGVYVSAADPKRRSYCVSAHWPFRRG